MLGLLVGKSGRIHGLELNSFGAWWCVVDRKGNRFLYKNINNEDCGDFILRAYEQSSRKEYKCYLKELHKDTV